MAFWGCEFVFDGLPCSEYGLMIYDFGTEIQGDASFQPGDVEEDRTARRYDTLMYGLTQNKSLEYTLVFGANTDSVDVGESLDRFEIEAIAAWLMGHDSRKWLAIVQDDMETFRYKCFISDLRLITYGNMPWAFSCRVSCDSPFAYTFPEKYEFSVAGTLSANLYNRSSYNGFFKPDIELDLSGTESLSIINNSDGGRVFAFSGLPPGETLTIHIDNKNQIITNSLGLNLYPNFNYNFFRMRRGDNQITINGTGKVKFICEFPVNIGA
jgi:phage-related protein